MFVLFRKFEKCLNPFLEQKVFMKLAEVREGNLSVDEEMFVIYKVSHSCDTIQPESV